MKKVVISDFLFYCHEWSQIDLKPKLDVIFVLQDHLKVI